jgi:hypothetical protein
MPPKKSKPKFRGRRNVGSAGKKGKKKASQKQIVNVTVTSSGSGGSSMGAPSQPLFMPNTYQQPIFTPASDPIKNTLSEVLKSKSQGSQVDIPAEIPARTPSKAYYSSGFEDIYGSNPMYSDKSPDSGYHSAPEFASRPQRRPLPQPRVRPPLTNPDGTPHYAGRGRKSVARLAWEAEHRGQL